MQILDNCWNAQAKHIISFIKNNEKLHCLPLFRIRTTLQDTLALTLHCIPCSLAGTPGVVFHSQPAQCNREQDHTLPAVRDTFPCRVPNFSTLGCILFTPQVTWGSHLWRPRTSFQSHPPFDGAMASQWLGIGGSTNFKYSFLFTTMPSTDKIRLGTTGNTTNLFLHNSWGFLAWDYSLISNHMMFLQKSWVMVLRRLSL